jgi:hypothetical protein
LTRSVAFYMRTQLSLWPLDNPAEMRTSCVFLYAYLILLLLSLKGCRQVDSHEAKTSDRTSNLSSKDIEPSQADKSDYHNGIPFFNTMLSFESNEFLKEIAGYFPLEKIGVIQPSPFAKVMYFLGDIMRCILTYFLACLAYPNYRISFALLPISFGFLYCTIFTESLKDTLLASFPYSYIAYIFQMERAYSS